ncbi:MAG: hypothetical protein IPG99_15825 [Ignavibacteria bacterium]|nr:hypothetical protein [Ignavibacteria bacterium]
MNPYTAVTLTSDITTCGCEISAGRQLREGHKSERMNIERLVSIIFTIQYG